MSYMQYIWLYLKNMIQIILNLKVKIVLRKEKEIKKLKKD